MSQLVFRRKSYLWENFLINPDIYVKLLTFGQPKTYVVNIEKNDGTNGF